MILQKITYAYTYFFQPISEIDVMHETSLMCNKATKQDGGGKKKTNKTKLW